MTPEYIRGAIRGQLAAQPRYRCLRPWHLDALAERLGDGAAVVITDLLGDGHVLRPETSSMPGAFSPGGGAGYSTVRAPQELAADWRLPAHPQDRASAHLRSAGHPDRRPGERAYRGRRAGLPGRPPAGLPAQDPRMTRGSRGGFSAHEGAGRAPHPPKGPKSARTGQIVTDLHQLTTVHQEVEAHHRRRLTSIEELEHSLPGSVMDSDLDDPGLRAAVSNLSGNDPARVLLHAWAQRVKNGEFGLSYDRAPVPVRAS